MTHHALLLASIACFALSVAVYRRIASAEYDHHTPMPGPAETVVIILLACAPPLAGITLLIAYLAQI